MLCTCILTAAAQGVSEVGDTVHTEALMIKDPRNHMVHWVTCRDAVVVAHQHRLASATRFHESSRAHRSGHAA